MTIAASGNRYYEVFDDKEANAIIDGTADFGKIEKKLYGVGISDEVEVAASAEDAKIE